MTGSTINDYLARQIASALSQPDPAPPSPLGAWFNPPAAKPTGILGSALARAPTPQTAPNGSLFGLAGPKRQPDTPSAHQARRVFYSFHYADVNRVNVVRQSGKIRDIDRERTKTVQDRSLWESRKSTDPAYLRRAISQNIFGTSATCVLAGRDTWERRWCRFEIARSLLNGNGIFAVRIDQLYCIGQRCRGTIGPNPLDFVAVGRDTMGRIHVYEQVRGGWFIMADMPKQLLRWPKWLVDVPHGYVRILSSGAPIYDYVTGDGARLLLRWANEAAKAAGR